MYMMFVHNAFGEGETSVWSVTMRFSRRSTKSTVCMFLNRLNRTCQTPPKWERPRPSQHNRHKGRSKNADYALRRGKPCSRGGT